MNTDTLDATWGEHRRRRLAEVLFFGLNTYANRVIVSSPQHRSRDQRLVRIRSRAASSA